MTSGEWYSRLDEALTADKSALSYNQRITMGWVYMQDVSQCACCGKLVDEKKEIRHFLEGTRQENIKRNITVMKCNKHI